MSLPGGTPTPGQGAPGRDGGLDWAGLLRLGLHGLRLMPEQFWRLTPAELMVMAGRDASPLALTRAGFEALARAYPDDTKGDDHGLQT